MTLYINPSQASEPQHVVFGNNPTPILETYSDKQLNNEPEQLGDEANW